MTSLTPAAILAKALEPYQGTREFVELIARAGVPRDAARRAMKPRSNRPTNASNHLRLCAVLGIEPVTGAACQAWEPRDVEGWFLGLGLRGHRMLNKHTLRQAVEVTGLAIATLSRIESGDPRSFDAMLAVCRYMNVDPLDYVRGFTGNICGKQLIAQANSEQEAA